MKRETVLGIAASLAFAALAMGVIVHAQSQREQLQQMVEQLQKTPTNNALREKIIKLSAEMKPAPVVPDEAIRFFDRAGAAFKTAYHESDFLAAAQEYEKAVAAAPWWGSAYYNMALALERASKFNEAIASFKLYMASVQAGSAEAREAQTRIYALEAKGGVYTGSPREQLQQMVEQLQKTPNDNALRERIIKLAAEIKPARAVPPEAEQFEGRAEYALKSAKSETEMLDAAREYLKAVNAAPWFAGYYFNLCTILEKANRPAEAMRACKLYLTAAPEALDAGDVRKRIAGLDYAIEHRRGKVTRRRRCGDTMSSMYEDGAKVAKIGASRIALQLISSLHAGVWRNRLMLVDIALRIWTCNTTTLIRSIRRFNLMTV